MFSDHSSPFAKQPMDFMTLREKPLENIVGKGENAGKQHFLLFPQFFLPCQKKIKKKKKKKKKNCTT